MTVPQLPAIHHITVDGEDQLATNDGYRWEKVGDGDSWAAGSKLVTDHGEVIPAGPVDRLVRLPDVGTPVRGDLCWKVDGKSTGLSAAITADNVREYARVHLVCTAQALAVVRAIEAEQAKPPTARERLLAWATAADGYENRYVSVLVADLRAVLEEQKP